MMLISTELQYFNSITQTLCILIVTYKLYIKKTKTF